MDISQIIHTLPSLIGNAVERNEWIGYATILLAMFLENLIPPIPSEVIMPLAGFYVSQGQLQFFPVIFSGLAGTVLGAFPWYGLGRLVNEERLEKWLLNYGGWIGINSRDFLKSRTWFAKYGKALIFWGRLVPGIRTLISLPAGIELMPIIPFVIWTTAGSLIWTLILTFAGIFLGESYNNVGAWIEPLAKSIKLIILFGFIGIVISIILRRLFKNNDFE